MDTKKTIEDSVNLLENVKYNDYLHGFLIIFVFFFAIFFYLKSEN